MGSGLLSIQKITFQLFVVHVAQGLPSTLGSWGHGLRTVDVLQSEAPRSHEIAKKGKHCSNKPIVCDTYNQQT